MMYIYRTDVKIPQSLKAKADGVILNIYEPTIKNIE